MYQIKDKDIRRSKKTTHCLQETYVKWKEICKLKLDVKIYHTNTNQNKLLQMKKTSQ